MAHAAQRLLVLLLSVALTSAGCDRKRAATNGPTGAGGGGDANVGPATSAAEPTPDPAVTAFLLGLVRDHGLDARDEQGWVVFAPSGVGLSATVRPNLSQSPGVDVVQIDFHVRLVGGRVVTQQVVGSGGTRAEAIASAENSFAVGTFHALLGAFVDPDEAHVDAERRVIGGRERIVTYGDILTKTMDGAPGNPAPRLGEAEHRAWHDPFQAALDASPLTPGLHAVDVYNAMVGPTQHLDVRLDGSRWATMEQQLRGIPWPRGGAMTSVRRFLIIQDVDDPTRPTKPSSRGDAARGR